jgi:hypothetical protein
MPGFPFSRYRFNPSEIRIKLLGVLAELVHLYRFSLASLVINPLLDEVENISSTVSVSDMRIVPGAR